MDFFSKRRCSSHPAHGSHAQSAAEGFPFPVLYQGGGSEGREDRPCTARPFSWAVPLCGGPSSPGETALLPSPPYPGRTSSPLPPRLLRLEGPRGVLFSALPGVGWGCFPPFLPSEVPLEGGGRGWRGGRAPLLAGRKVPISVRLSSGSPRRPPPPQGRRRACGAAAGTSLRPRRRS